MPRKNRTATPPATPIDVKTASEMARACLLRNLQRHFDGFLREAKLHELYLLDNILMDFESISGGREESALAEAFMLALDSDDTYVKVPRELIEATEQFLAAASEPVGRPKLLAFPTRQRDLEVPHAS